MSKTYQPDSLHPYIMDARLKKATGSGGISSIPIASADTVGGIKIGGSDNPITITGSGNASVRKATSELLGVVKAGEGLTVDAEGAISVLPIAYSSAEVETGETYNGAKVYAKEITLAQPTAITVSDYPTLIADVSGYAQFISITALQQGGGCLPVNVFIETGTAKTHAFDAYTCIGYLIKYTKTTP